MGCGRILSVLRRCKELSGDSSTELARCLGLRDLTALGVGSTLGLGVYVLAGAVAKDVAGPAVVISFLVAAIASAFAGLCYAEFAARVPKAGSAYVYSYVSVGEFIAFTIGWNLILEYVIGTASVAKGMSNYIDSLCNNTIAKTMIDWAPINVSFLADYPDFFAFVLVLLITILLGVGVRESTKLNNVFTALNLITVVVVVIAGAVKSDPGNWNISKADIPAEYQDKAGEGGFMPWGVAGIMAGAAKCFFGFVGFDCVATTGEEAKNPKKDIPLSIVLSLIIIFASYFSVATVLTMMWPYYLQDANAPFPHVFNEIRLPTIKWIVRVGAVFALCTSLLCAMFPLPRVLYTMGSDEISFRPLANIHKKTQTHILATDADAPFPHVFSEVGLPAIKWIVTVGAVFALCTSLLGAMFPLPRVLYAMGSDGIIFRPLANINKKTQTPILATALSGLLSAVMAMIFNLNQLIDMMSIGTLLAYTIVATSVLILRYEEQNPLVVRESKPRTLSVLATAAQACNLLGLKEPSRLSSAVAKICIGIFFVVSLAACLVAPWANGAILGAAGALLLALLVALLRQPRQDTRHLTFTVPLVPLVPCLSVLMNVYLMAQLDRATWMRFAGWLLLGYLIYFFYGVRNSSLNEKKTDIPISMTNGKMEDKANTTKF